MAARQGLNGTLAYTDGSKSYTYQVRIGDIGYGVDMIFAEDQGRTQRSFYPHRTANQQFSVQVLLKSWDERSDLMTWMTSYAQFALDPTAVRTVFPFMQVTCPVRNFSQQGMPLKGYEWGAHAGMMAFSPVFTFEAAQSPGQVSSTVLTSSVAGTATAYASDPAVQYFYPFSTQLDASQVPIDYGQVIPSPGVAPAAQVTDQNPPAGVSQSQWDNALNQIGVVNSGTVAGPAYPPAGTANPADAALSPGIALGG
jgi:hypothetical protein